MTVDNRDRAIATISHAVVGDYTFKLTVTDNEGLQASTAINLQVKPGKYLINMKLCVAN